LVGKYTIWQPWSGSNFFLIKCRTIRRNKGQLEKEEKVLWACGAGLPDGFVLDQKSQFG
jgi:hypothetical protein